MQGSSDETANSVEEGSSSGRSEGSSNEAASSRASQSAGSPGSELQSDDMADSEALKEEEEDEEEEEEDDDDDDEEEVNRNFAETQKEQMREQTESRKRKAGEALGEGVGPSGSIFLHHLNPPDSSVLLPAHHHFPHHPLLCQESGQVTVPS